MEGVAFPPAVPSGSVLFAPDERSVRQAEAQKPRILIVEDEFLVAGEIESALAEAGFEVVGTASTAAQAVRLAKAERPKLVVMDIRLAGRRDGIDAAIMIYNATGIRSIFATAHDEQRVRQRAEPALPLGWLAKPYQLDSLIALVREALKQLEQ
jgi:two-component system, response regulator PdtaR